MTLLREGALLPIGRELTFIKAPLEDALLYFQGFRSNPERLINQLPLHHIELGPVTIESWPELLLMQNYHPRYLVMECANPAWTAIVGGMFDRSSGIHEEIIGREKVGWGSVGAEAASYLRGVDMPHEHTPVELFSIEMRITRNTPVDFNSREFNYGTYLLCVTAPYQRPLAADQYPFFGLDHGSSVYMAHGAFAQHGLQVLDCAIQELPDWSPNPAPTVTIPDGDPVYKHFNHRVVEEWAHERGIRPFDEDFYSGPAHLFVPYHPKHGYQEQSPRISFEDFQRFQCSDPDYNRWLCEQGLF